MIKVNLLDYRKERLKSAIQMEIFTALIVIALVLGAVGAVASHQRGRVADLQAEVAVKKKELNALKAVQAKVTQYERNQKELQTIVKTISDLKKHQRNPARLYDIILNQLLVPLNEAWLDRLSENSTGIVLEGNAFRDSAVSAFMKSLQETKIFAAVTLQYSRQKTDRKRKIRKFKMTCRFKEGIYPKAAFRTRHPKGGVFGMGGMVGQAMSREAAFKYGQQLSTELKQMPRNPFIEARNKARAKAEEVKKKVREAEK